MLENKASMWSFLPWSSGHQHVIHSVLVPVSISSTVVIEPWLALSTAARAASASCSHPLNIAAAFVCSVCIRSSSCITPQDANIASNAQQSLTVTEFTDQWQLLHKTVKVAVNEVTIALVQHLIIYQCLLKRTDMAHSFTRDHTVIPATKQKHVISVTNCYIWFTYIVMSHTCLHS